MAVASRVQRIARSVFIVKEMIGLGLVKLVSTLLRREWPRYATSLLVVYRWEDVPTKDREKDQERIPQLETVGGRNVGYLNAYQL